MTNRKRCERCQRPEKLCYCSHLTPIDNRWPVQILQHPQESRHALGTARIASLGLSQCMLTLWNGDCSRFVESSQSLDSPCGSEPSSRFLDVSRSVDRGQGSLQQAQDNCPVLIYPGDDALPLAALATQPPRPLIFLDATWRKSRRMLFESPWLAALPRHALQSPPPGRYRIRKEPAANALSTLEAIVYTLGQLEADQSRYDSLLHVMDTLIEQQIHSMGHDTFVRNYDGCVSE